MLQQEVMENKNQADTIAALREGIADERRGRQADAELNRKAFADIMALEAKLADKVADIGTDVAVLKSGGRRTERTDTSPPVRDAQVMQGR